MAMRGISLAVLCLLMVAASAQDINTVRKEALQKVEILVKEVIKTKNQTKAAIQPKLNIVQDVYNKIKDQGENIKKHNLVEISNEARSSYLKADILESNYNVYGCIAHAANDGEVSIERDYQEKFLMKINADQQSTMKIQNQEKANWEKNSTAQEDIYEEKHNDVNKKIYNAQKLDEINKLVSEFTNHTNNIKKIFTDFVPKLRTIHVSYYDRMHKQVQDIRLTLINTKNNVFAVMHKCLGGKIMK